MVLDTATFHPIPLGFHRSSKYIIYIVYLVLLFTAALSEVFSRTRFSSCYFSDIFSCQIHRRAFEFSSQIILDLSIGQQVRAV